MQVAAMRKYEAWKYNVLALMAKKVKMCHLFTVKNFGLVASKI